MTLIKIILALVLLTIVISYLGSNVVLASTIRVTQQQAELIEWCTKEMVRVTDASMVQALNVCAEYYLKVE
jgi:type II secretory pathway pseudopilin PulG